MSKPCEYCGYDLPVGVDKKTRQVRSHHFDICTARPKKDGYEAGKREWVGLNDEQVIKLRLETPTPATQWGNTLSIAKALSGKLKELNHEV
jgi:hypothetical protein